MAHAHKTIHIVGAGLAGSECAYQLAEMGFQVKLYEMRPETLTPAHKTANCAELVCSNSFGSQTDYSAPGQLKWEAEKLGSIILKCARDAAVPAGMALGVDRQVFPELVSKAIESHTNIELISKKIESLDDIPRPAVIATGPLTDSHLAESMRAHFDNEFMYFYDAIAPIIDTDSINMDICWKADRFNKSVSIENASDQNAAEQNASKQSAGAYINCPLNKEQYYNLLASIKAAKKIEPKDFEKAKYFEGCMPIEAIIERGDETLRFGPMSGKGLINPKTDRTAYAVVQLRQDNKQATAYNMVGFQTKMAYADQKEVFRQIPGLEDAEFLKLGSMHRNLYIHSPKRLTPYLSSKKDEWLFFAGQITGVEGYFESTCIGLLIAHILQDKLNGREPLLPDRRSALGSIVNAITEEKEHFQPTNINFSLMPAVNEAGMRGRKGREQRRELQLERAKFGFEEWLAQKSGPESPQDGVLS